MRKTNLLYSLLFLSSVIGMFSCTKSNNINNGQVIEAPYALYFSDTAGTVYVSNNGKDSKVVFAADGVPARTIFGMNKNLLVGKHSLYVSSNEGRNFNYSYDVTKMDTTDRKDVRGHRFSVNQTMAIFVPGWNHGYIVSTQPGNFFGFAWNEGDGVGGWTPEDYMDTNTTVHTSNLTMSTFTLSQSGILYTYDARNRRGFMRPSLNQRWQEIYIAAGDSGFGVAPSPAFYSLGHLRERLILIDNYGIGGASYSDDGGKHWSAFTGVPANTPLTCVASPFEQITLVGTDSAGLYMINPNTNSFQQLSNGLPANLIVRNIAYKENIFKNGTRAQYVYLATNQGIYQSSDLGNNWTRTIKGNFVTIY